MAHSTDANISNSLFITAISCREARLNSKHQFHVGETVLSLAERPAFWTPLITESAVPQNTEPPARYCPRPPAGISLWEVCSGLKQAEKHATADGGQRQGI